VLAICQLERNANPVFLLVAGVNRSARKISPQGSAVGAAIWAWPAYGNRGLGPLDTVRRTAQYEFNGTNFSCV